MPLIRIPQVPSGYERFGVEFDCGSRLAKRFFGPSGRGESHRDDHGGIAGKRVNAQRSPCLRDPLINAPRCPLKKEETVPAPRLHILRVECEGFEELSFGFLKIPLPEERGARQRVVRFC
jgi:hypothetical protein